MLRYIGEKFLTSLRDLNGIISSAVYSISSFLFSSKHGRRAASRVLYKQVYFTGIEALPIISWIAILLGIIIVTEAMSILPQIGGERFIGKIMVWVVIRELGPLFAAIIVIARSGTAMAAELGSMKINNEVMAIEAMGIDPQVYLVVPRVIGASLAIFILTFYFEVISVLGGYLLAGFGTRMSFHVYASSILEAINITDIIASLLKSLFFGLIIGAVCCYHGLKVGRSITEIPQETTKAVITSLFLIFVVDGMVTMIFFFI
ncbi:MAG: hypothetical protein A2073_08100 [Deltaproteobacteria bacterium GWC2_42_11]|nr:MAG: hypothetical protein A2073_08100 [Deltaproteobacteria bacterium GWC2_42_11]HBO84940.1 ABC transporter permease [Deltaproteobacteria bacterium]